MLYNIINLFWFLTTMTSIFTCQRISCDIIHTTHHKWWNFNSVFPCCKISYWSTQVYLKTHLLFQARYVLCWEGLQATINKLLRVQRPDPSEHGTNLSNILLCNNFFVTIRILNIFQQKMVMKNSNQQRIHRSRVEQLFEKLDLDKVN